MHGEDSKNLLTNSDTLQIYYRHIEHSYDENCYWKNHFLKMTATLTSPSMSIHMYVCIGFPSHIQREANMHFNTFLFSIHKTVITLRGVSNKYCLLAYADLLYASNV